MVLGAMGDREYHYREDQRKHGDFAKEGDIFLNPLYREAGGILCSL
jgi:hypothetical protein